MQAELRPLGRDDPFLRNFNDNLTQHLTSSPTITRPTPSSRSFRACGTFEAPESTVGNHPRPAHDRDRNLVAPRNIIQVSDIKLVQAMTAANRPCDIEAID